MVLISDIMKPNLYINHNDHNGVDVDKINELINQVAAAVIEDFKTAVYRLIPIISRRDPVQRSLMSLFILKLLKTRKNRS